MSLYMVPMKPTTQQRRIFGYPKGQPSPSTAPDLYGCASKLAGLWALGTSCLSVFLSHAQAAGEFGQ